MPSAGTNAIGRSIDDLITRFRFSFSPTAAGVALVPTVDSSVARKRVNRDPTAAVLPPFGAGLMAIFIAVAAYAVASTVAHALTSHMAQIAKSLIVAPLIEELFFRGVVQSRLRAHGGFWGRPWVAIGVTAACFALAHLATASAGHAALVIAPALAIGCVYERTHSIPLCIALHSAANAIWICFWSI